jgi:hypothetical protein
MLQDNTLTDAIIAPKQRWTNGRLYYVGAALLVAIATAAAITATRSSQEVCPNQIESWVYYNGAYFPYLVTVPDDGSKTYKFIAFRQYMIVDDGEDPHNYSNSEGCGGYGWRQEGRGQDYELVESYELKEGNVFYIDENPYQINQIGSLFFAWGDDFPREVTHVEADLTNVAPTRASVQAFVETKENVIAYFEKIAANWED